MAIWRCPGCRFAHPGYVLARLDRCGTLLCNQNQPSHGKRRSWAMSDGRKTKFKEPMQDIDLPKMKLEVESEAKPETPLTAEQIYLKRQAEVAQQDNEDFSDYLREKASRDQQQAPQPEPTPQTAPAPQTAPKKLNRRSLLTSAAGTPLVGQPATPPYPLLPRPLIPTHRA